MAWHGSALLFDSILWRSGIVLMIAFAWCRLIHCLRCHCCCCRPSVWQLRWDVLLQPGAVRHKCGRSQHTRLWGKQWHRIHSCWVL